MPIEYEAKFTVTDPDVFRRIASLREIASCAAKDRGIQRHRDTYFDTDDLRLLRSKIVFRLREKATGAMLAFKAQAPGGGGGEFFRRMEIEAPAKITAADIASGNLPDLPPSRELLKRLGPVRLSPALTVDNRRRTIVLSRNGVPRFELALDEVTFTGPRGKASVREIEVESMGWGDEGLAEVGNWLAEKFELACSGPSKYILGMELVGKRPGE
jgi:inorganic triphosphatase YgiF